jgi:type II secretory pathway pseudopilin PulG
MPKNAPPLFFNLPPLDKKIGFSLIEAMVAVSIFSIGLVLVLRSFLTVTQALNSASLRIEAIQALEAKMNIWEQKEKEEQGLKAAALEEDIYLGAHRAKYSLISADLGDSLAENVIELKLSFAWQQGNRREDEGLATYFNEKE